MDEVDCMVDFGFEVDFNFIFDLMFVIFVKFDDLVVF